MDFDAWMARQGKDEAEVDNIPQLIKQQIEDRMKLRQRMLEQMNKQGVLNSAFTGIINTKPPSVSDLVEQYGAAFQSAFADRA